MKKTEIIKRIIIFAIAFLLAIALFKFKIGIPCIFNKITGLYCPGCGATRAVYSLLEFNFYQAIRYNALAVILLPLGIGLIFYRYVLKGKKRVPNYIWYIIVVVVLLFGLLRNIPLFSYLAPKDPIKNIDGVTIEAREYMSRELFVISPEKEKNEKTILYFHGGAYMAEMTEAHWSFVQNLAKDTKSTIIVLDYPLAPFYTYKDVLKISEALYLDTIKKVQPSNLMLMGDSAGGGIVLGLEEKLALNNIELPYKTVLISPWLDTTMTNPKQEEIQPYDKKLNKTKLYIAGILYSRGINQNEEYFVNPLYGDVSKLKNITIFTGTYDILNPDSHIVQEKAQKNGLNIQIKEYNTASHIWIIDENNDLAKQAYNNLLIEIGE